MNEGIPKKRVEGSITIFAALSFMVTVSVICALIDGARVQGARVMAAMAADMALDSLFSGYERELLDKYGVLFFDGANEGDELDIDYLSSSLKESIQNKLDADSGLLFTKSTDFYGIEVEEVSIDNIFTATDACGLVWRKAVNDYAVMDYSAELVEKLLGIEKMDEENKAVMSATEYLDDCIEETSDFYGIYLSLIEHMDGIKTSSSGVNFGKLRTRDVYVKRIASGGNVDISQEEISISNYQVYEAVKAELFDVNSFKSIFMDKFSKALVYENLNIEELKGLSEVLRGFLGSLKREIALSMGLIDELRSRGRLLGAKVWAAVEYIDSISEISLQSIQGLKDELEDVKKQQEEVIKRLGDIDAMYEVLSYDYGIIEEVCSFCVDMGELNDNGSNIQIAQEWYKEYESAFELLSGYRTDSMYLDYEGMGCRESDEGILGCVYDYAMNGMLALVLPEGEKLSTKSIGNMQLADVYGERGDRSMYVDNVGADIMNELLFNIYTGDHFDCFTDKDSHGLLDYEQEFILYGKSTDKENLACAVMAVAGVRLGGNLTYIFTDAEKKQEAHNIALAALGFTGIMAAVKALQYVIMTAWAIGETVVDMRMLLAGKSVPLIKKKGDWRLELDMLLAGKLDIGDDAEGDGEKGDDGLGYSQYLSALMLFENTQDKAYRTMALVEMHMIHEGVDNFRLKNYIYGMDITITYYVGDRRFRNTERCSYSY